MNEQSFGQHNQEMIRKSGPEFFDILEDESVQARLKEDIAKHDGLVRIFVHPYFEQMLSLKGVESSNLDSEIETRYEKLNNSEDPIDQRESRVTKGFMRVLESSDEQTPPVLVFEEKESMSISQKIIEKLAPEIKRPVYYIPTHRWDPVPIIAGELPTDRYGQRKGADEAWELLSEYFKDLGIKKILLGGQLLYLNTDYNYSHPGNVDKGEEVRDRLLGDDYHELKASFKGCVFETYRHLFENMGDIIELSNMSYPNNSNDINRLKQGQEIIKS